MKIYIFANGFTLEGMSGGDRFFIEVGKEWSTQGHEVHIFTPKIGYNVCRREGAIDCIFHITKSPGIEKLGLTGEYLFRMVATSFTPIPGKPDIVFSSSDYIYDVLPSYLLKNKWNDIIWLTTVFHIILPPSQRRGKSLQRDFESFISQRISLSLIKRKIDIILTDNYETRDALVKFKIPSSKIHLTIGAPNFAQIKGVQIKGKEFDACYLGRIHSNKGVFDLVTVWKLVCEAKNDAKLVMVGTGDEEAVKRLKETIAKNHLEDNIVLAGFVSEEEKYEILKKSQVFVFASYEEGWPTVFSEAMACSLPVIAYFLPAYMDFEESILKIKVGDTKEFADKIVQTLSNQNLKNKFIMLGSDVVNKFSWKTIASDILDWYTTSRKLSPKN